MRRPTVGIIVENIVESILPGSGSSPPITPRRSTASASVPRRPTLGGTPRASPWLEKLCYLSSSLLTLNGHKDPVSAHPHLRRASVDWTEYFGSTTRAHILG